MQKDDFKLIAEAYGDVCKEQTEESSHGMMSYEEVVQYLGERAFHANMSGSMNGLFYDLGTNHIAKICRVDEKKLLADAKAAYERFKAEYWNKHKRN